MIRRSFLKAIGAVLVSPLTAMGWMPEKDKYRKLAVDGGFMFGSDTETHIIDSIFRALADGKSRQYIRGIIDQCARIPVMMMPDGSEQWKWVYRTQCVGRSPIVPGLKDGDIGVRIVGNGDVTSYKIFDAETGEKLGGVTGFKVSANVENGVVACLSVLGLDGVEILPIDAELLEIEVVYGVKGIKRRHPMVNDMSGRHSKSMYLFPVPTDQGG